MESISPITLVLGLILLVFGHFEPIQAVFETPLTQARAMLSWGPGQIVIVHVLRTCAKKNLEKYPTNNCSFETYFSSFWSY